MKFTINQKDISISFDLDFDNSKFSKLVDKIIEFKMAKFENSVRIQELLDQIQIKTLENKLREFDNK